MKKKNPVNVKDHSVTNDEDDRRRTLSGEQDLLSIARQPEPRWRLSVGKHLYPVHKLLTPVTKIKIVRNVTIKIHSRVIVKARRLLTECRQAS